MSESEAFWLILGLIAGSAFTCSMFYLRDWKREVLRRRQERELRTETLDVKNWHPVQMAHPADNIELYPQKPNDFAVNGPPRRKPWVVRKRELEEAARTKRKKLESFTEYV